MKLLPFALVCVFLSLGLLWACTPKTTEPVVKKPTTQTPKPQDPNEKLSPCPKFSDAPNPDDIETSYVLYRDYLRAGETDKAFKMWRKVYSIAPAADGRRNTVYADGIRFYEYYGGQAKDSMVMRTYIDSIFMIYDQIDNCYPEGGYVKGRKAFDYFYKYPDRASKEETWQLFKESIDTDGLDAQYFVINPFASLLVERFEAGKISEAEAKRYTDLLYNIIAKGTKECEGEECEAWKAVEGYAPIRLEAFEVVRGFYDCDYYVNKYYREFKENPEDCDVIRTVFSRLRYGNCPQDQPELLEVAEAGNTNCVTEAGPLRQAYDALQNGEYSTAIEQFKAAAENAEDAEKKGNYLLLVSKIYYSQLKNYSQARNYARQAAAARSGWGEPYLLIGRLYASSGPLCGPGRGWDSQVVVWAAIDQWNRAKQIDPSATAEANKWINRYAQYMPNKEDIFLRNLSTGSSYFVGCWIQESTTIRTSN